ncbi:hypothetical protein EXIGLDRAFT_835190 [Exidia glandulosa HHB12029]|uniref:Fungal-type protein kinase domain-containing protein n=1 Tax=Exidia glandulosa HHB12029 TaxID=1314781 RepID=A0A165IZJ7_EXIGL|nr:hypothetical protein EXIGLDRAFT_835190 [Exidia glandulosa HHB12029]
MSSSSSSSSSSVAPGLGSWRSSSGSSSSAPSSHYPYGTGNSSILEKDAPPEVPLSVFDAAVLCSDLDGLHVLVDEACERYSTVTRSMAQSTDVVHDILELLNGLSKLYTEHFYEPPDKRIEFIDHSHAALSHHPRKSTVMRPHIIAVHSRIAKSWRSSHTGNAARPPAVPWHHVQAAVLVDTLSDDAHALDRCASFLGALNQARPDLPGSFSVTATRQSCCLLWSDVSTVCSTPRSAWSDRATMSSLLQFVYRLHDPAQTDLTVQLESTSSADDTTSAASHSGYDSAPVWLIEDENGSAYRATHVLAVGRPWSQKNWVAAATQRRASGAMDFMDCPRVVVKDSWPLVANEDTSESAILEHIHADGDIPGVCRVLSSFPVRSDGYELGNLFVAGLAYRRRRKRRLILDGTAEDIYTCTSVVDFLKVMYDVIEVLRHIHETRGILHRDISLRNILRAAADAAPLVSARREGSPIFINDVLSHKYPNTRAGRGPLSVLVDFDNAFWHGKSPDRGLRAPVGTPEFVARTVSTAFEMPYRLPPARIRPLEGSAKECFLHAFGEERYDALPTAISATREVFNQTDDGESPVPDDRRVHSPRHDIESCFFVIVHFLITALPEGADPRDDNVGKGTGVCRSLENYEMGQAYDTRACVWGMGSAGWLQAMHRALHSFVRFLLSMATLFNPTYDLHSPPLPLYHLHDAVQRLLLAEICRALDDNTDVALDIHRRRDLGSVYDISPLWSMAAPNTPAPSSGSSRKRRAESSTCDSDDTRRRRLS